MAFSWVSPGRTEEADCNEAPYLVAEGRIRRVTCGQLGRNNESFLFLSVSVSTPPPVSCEDGGSSGNFFFFGGEGGGFHERRLEAKSSTARRAAQHCRYLTNMPHMPRLCWPTASELANLKGRCWNMRQQSREFLKWHSFKWACVQYKNSSVIQTWQESASSESHLRFQKLFSFPGLTFSLYIYYRSNLWHMASPFCCCHVTNIYFHMWTLVAVSSMIKC